MNDSKCVQIAFALLLIICLFDMPYGYYQFVRYMGLIGFSYLAYMANHQGLSNTTIVFVALAVLFQPIVKIALGRVLWNVVDVAVAILLLNMLQKPKLLENR